jgi:tRNA A-37 threonylcarbamoyl transferase component Bud32
MPDPASGTPPFIGRYRLVERIGKGAMGMVYAADDEVMGRRVAVKVMMADLEQEPETRERFYREAKVTGQLLHRNIVTVYDLGEDQGRPYIVMELLLGVPLGEYLHRPDARPLDVRIDLMLQICDGLQIAHERGIIHRDIKPNNLFVQRDGSLKILDFGVARLATSTLTGSGFLVGTPEYMSPEQAMGRSVDARSDVFSAAAVFYFMVTGRPPFGALDLPKVLNAVMFNPPAPFSDGDAPDALARVLFKALEKDPDQRHRSCTELAADLEAVRRAQDSDRLRVSHAALDRYRQVVALIEERRGLGRRLHITAIDAFCDESLAKMTERFPEFARHAATGSLMEPMDPSVASAALMVLQKRYNTELAAVAALREQCADSIGREGAADIDLTLRRHGGSSPANDMDGDATEPASLRERAAALLHKLRADRGQATTEWLTIAGILTGVGAFLLGSVPRGLEDVLRAMAESIRTFAQ